MGKRLVIQAVIDDRTPAQCLAAHGLVATEESISRIPHETHDPHNPCRCGVVEEELIKFDEQPVSGSVIGYTFHPSEFDDDLEEECEHCSEGRVICRSCSGTGCASCELLGTVPCEECQQC